MFDLLPTHIRCMANVTKLEKAVLRGMLSEAEAARGVVEAWLAFFKDENHAAMEWYEAVK
jgi:hypothetical protein